MKKLLFNRLGWIERPACASFAAIATLALLILPVTPAKAAGVNTNPDFLPVYVNNLENLSGLDARVVPEDNIDCRAEYLDLIEYIKTQDYVPDLFLVQQISDYSQADEYVTLLFEEFGVSYSYLIAHEPGDDRQLMTIAMDCNIKKRLQTNAIFYRVDRLIPDGDRVTWQTYDLNLETSGRCDTLNDDQDRTLSIRARFFDILAQKYVAAGSSHWPTGNPDDVSECNIVRSVAENMDKYTSSDQPSPADLTIFGGDLNEDDLPYEDQVANGDEVDEWKSWYKKVNGALASPGEENYGYTDVIYSLCSDSIDIMECSRINKTLRANPDYPNRTRRRRIDFLFAKWLDSSETVRTDSQYTHTITFEDANAANPAGDPTVRYSDHRAIRSRVYYDIPAVNHPPSFDSDPIIKPDAEIGTAYNQSLAGDASDPDGDALIFSKVSGPDWLTLGGDGQLGGTPCSSVGSNSFSVAISDGRPAGEDPDVVAALLIDVQAASGPSLTVAPGSDQSITLPVSQVSLSGSVNQNNSCPPVPGYTVEWSKVSGIGNVTFSNRTSLTTTAEFDAADENGYVLRLTAIDDAGNPPEFAELTVIVKPETVSDPVVLEQSTRTGSLVYVSNTQNVSQSFRHTTPGGAVYWITQVNLSLKFDDDRPNQNLEFNIDGVLQGTGLGGSQVSISPNDLTDSWNSYDILFSNPVGPFNSGETYYLSFSSGVNFSRRYHIRTSGYNAGSYPDGQLYKSGSAQTRDARFTITGTQ